MRASFYGITAVTGSHNRQDVSPLNSIKNVITLLKTLQPTIDFSVTVLRHQAKAFVSSRLSHEQRRLQTNSHCFILVHANTRTPGLDVTAEPLQRSQSNWQPKKHCTDPRSNYSVWYSVWNIRVFLLASIPSLHAFQRKLATSAKKLFSTLAVARSNPVFWSHGT